MSTSVNGVGGRSVHQNVFKDEITHPGRYVLAIQGSMTPGEVFVNDESTPTFSLYSTSADATIILYLLPGDNVRVTGAYSALRKLVYSS